MRPSLPDGRFDIWKPVIRLRPALKQAGGSVGFDRLPFVRRGFQSPARRMYGTFPALRRRPSAKSRRVRSVTTTEWRGTGAPALRNQLRVPTARLLAFRLLAYPTIGGRFEPMFVACSKALAILSNSR